MRSCALLVVLLSLGCKKEATAPPVPPAPTEVKRSALELVPPADGVLSLFEPAKDGCEWRRVDAASGRSATIASFAGSCVGARVAFSPDAQRALVWFDPRTVQSAGVGGSDVGAAGYPDEVMDEKAKARVFLVVVKTGEVKPVPLPPFEFEELGIDATGVIALSLDTLTDEVVAAGKTLVDGTPFELTPVDEGVPALAHAWRLEGSTWKRVETKQTTTGWDYGPGVHELDVWDALGPRSTQLLDTHPMGHDDPDEATVKKLSALKPKLGEGEWLSWGKAPKRVFGWAISGEFEHTTGHLAFEGPPPVMARGIGFTDGDLVAVRLKGAYLLVAAGWAGTHPRVYLTDSPALVWSSDSARGTTFWP